jgi:hypothetical protein
LNPPPIWHIACCAGVISSNFIVSFSPDQHAVQARKLNFGGAYTGFSANATNSSPAVSEGALHKEIFPYFQVFMGSYIRLTFEKLSQHVIKRVLS